jgi:hypothetical protein
MILEAGAMDPRGVSLEISRIRLQAAWPAHLLPRYRSSTLRHRAAATGACHHIPFTSMT